MGSSRFTFPKFELAHTADTATHEVEVGNITVGASCFTVHMVRKAGLPFEASFLVSAVYKSDELLWTFKEEQFTGLGFLAMADNDVVVALVGKTSGAVERIVPLAHIGAPSAMNVRNQMRLKIAAARFLKKSWKLSLAETRVLKVDIERRKMTEEKKYDKRELLRQERKASITGRIMIGVSVDGQSRFGYPVVEDEWQVLDDGSFVVLVESYNNGIAGTPLETFIVRKAPGRSPAKFALRKVSRVQQVAAKQSQLPRPEATDLFEIDGEPYEVAIYKGSDEIRTLREHGLNGGTRVAVAVDNKPGRFTIYAVHGDHVDTLGEFSPFA